MKMPHFKYWSKIQHSPFLKTDRRLSAFLIPITESDRDCSVLYSNIYTSFFVIKLEFNGCSVESRSSNHAGISRGMSIPLSVRSVQRLNNQNTLSKTKTDVAKTNTNGSRGI